MDVQMSTSSRTIGNVTVCLFREPEDPDPYEAAFRTAGFGVFSIPVLTFRFIGQEGLIAKLERPNSYGGLILTSPRAVQALAEALKWLPGEVVLWHTKPVFAVGKRTASELRAIGFRPEGEESGSGALLARYIVRREVDRPLLFLCGNLRRDEIPSALKEAGVPFEELQVYETLQAETIDLSSHPKPDWVVFFSPSGVEAVSRAADLDWINVRLAAIGETTAEAIHQRGFDVEAVAAEPTPESLLEAILATYTP